MVQERHRGFFLFGSLLRSLHSATSIAPCSDDRVHHVSCAAMAMLDLSEAFL